MNHIDQSLYREFKITKNIDENLVINGTNITCISNSNEWAKYYHMDYAIIITCENEKYDHLCFGMLPNGKIIDGCFISGKLGDENISDGSILFWNCDEFLKDADLQELNNLLHKNFNDAVVIINGKVYIHI